MLLFKNPVAPVVCFQVLGEASTQADTFEVCGRCPGR